MASARKKLDEKNLKTLRELVSLNGNKHCFDCNQRGPTYVNMTIGSFVCTKCSGMLRGLRPPHRVKSISMASFTQDEVDFVKSHGNIHSRQTWLALYDQKYNGGTNDEEEIKEFMRDKYELKRYYHETGLQNGALPTIAHPSTAFNPIVDPTEPAPFVNLEWTDKKGFRIKEKSDAKNIANSNNFKNTINDDFVADFNSANIFNTSQFNNNTANTATTQASFANFDNNVIFNSATPTTYNTYPSYSPPTIPSSNNVFLNQLTQNQLFVTNANRWNVTSPPTVNGNTMNSVSPMSKIQAPPSEDRYAALKDLDNALKVQMQPEQPLEWSAGASSNGSGYTSPLFGSPSTTGGSMYGSPSQGNFASFQHQPEVNNVSNPFSLSASPRSPWSPSAANGASQQPTNNTVIANNCFPVYNNGVNANPFRTAENGFNRTTNKYNNGTNCFNNSNGFTNTNGYTNSNGFNSSNGFQQNLFASPVSSSQFNKPWATDNPFALGVSPTSGSNSSNPFL